MLGQNKTLVTEASSSTQYTGSIQKLFTTGSAKLARVEFGYWRRKGTSGTESEAIVSSVVTEFTVEAAAGGFLEGPIVRFKTAPDIDSTLIYSNNTNLG
tara:strand:+ start:2067 stop:2363 length:297 start_codon:yes stop_codon:yes gene_type:complete